MKIRPPGQNALSLVEILLSFAVISVLATLALVGMNQVQTYARATQNLRNHQEIGRALIQSAYDHSGALPYCDHGSSAKLSYPRFLVQGGYISDYRVFYSPYAGDWYQAARYSPALRRPNIAAVEPWFYTNYGVNRRGAMPHALDDTGRRPARLPVVAQDGNLSKLMLIRDTYRPGYDTPSQSYGGGIPYFSGSGWTYIPPPEKTYNGFMHVTFADGHVEKVTRQSMVNDIAKDESEEPYFKDRYTRY